MLRMLTELKQIGLSDKEAKVYFAALELGSGTIQQIAQRAGINRITGHVIVENFLKRGLMSFVEKNNRRFFSVSSPDILLRSLRRELSEIENREETLLDILPKLNSFFESNGSKPKVRFYEGFEGLKVVREDLLRSQAKVARGFVSLDDLFKMFPEHESEYTTRRVKRGIKSKVLYTTKFGQRADANDESKLREARFLPQEKFPLASEITIYGDKVAIIPLLGKPVGVVIENEAIASTMKAIFELAWQGAEKYNRF